MTENAPTSPLPFVGQKLPRVNESPFVSPPDLCAQFSEACRSWLARSPSRDTRANYARDLGQFLAFVGIRADQPEQLVAVLPRHVAAWRDHLKELGLTNSSVRRKMTVLRSMFSYLQT